MAVITEEDMVPKRKEKTGSLLLARWPVREFRARTA